MATIINGTDLVLKVRPGISEDTPAGTLLALAAGTSCTVNVTIDTGEVTDKTSGDRKEFIGISSSWTMDADVFYNNDGNNTFLTLWEAAYGDTNESQNTITQRPRHIEVQFFDGTNAYTGNGYITSISASGGTEDAGTYNISVQGTGDLTKTP